MERSPLVSCHIHHFGWMGLEVLGLVPLKRVVPSSPSFVFLSSDQRTCMEIQHAVKGRFKSTGAKGMSCATAFFSLPCLPVGHDESASSWVRIS